MRRSRGNLWLALILCGCGGTAPEPKSDSGGKGDDGLFLSYMKGNDVQIAFLEAESSDEKAMKRLKIIRENILRAREVLPEKFKWTRPHFDPFLDFEKQMELEPWNPEKAERLRTACDRCHEQAGK